MTVKIDIISGFLGAGKTTLIKKLIDEKLSHEKLVLIENEFGETGIDGSILKRANMEVKEINSGCICCMLVGDFERSIQEAVTKFRPDRILIEPSGVGKLSDVIKACEGAGRKADISIGMLVTVVDALKCYLYLQNFGEFYGNQIANARTVILSRTQMADRKQLDRTVKAIRKLNPGANLITTPWDLISSDRILEVAERVPGYLLEHQLCEQRDPCGCGQEHGLHEHLSHDPGSHDGREGHLHNADEFFEVWSTETHRTFTESEIKDILNNIGNSKKCGLVLRGKGIVRTDAGGWVQFDYVPGEIQIQETHPDYSGRICMIGRGINRAELARLFNL